MRKEDQPTQTKATGTRTPAPGRAGKNGRAPKGATTVPAAGAVPAAQGATGPSPSYSPGPAGPAGEDARASPAPVREAAARAEAALHDRAGFERWLRDRLPDRGFRPHWSEHPSVDVLARYLNAAAAWAFEIDAGRARLRTVGATDWCPLPDWTGAWLRAASDRREVVEGDGPPQTRLTRAAALAALVAPNTVDAPARPPPPTTATGQQAAEGG
jgi:hypothetical protein